MIFGRFKDKLREYKLRHLRIGKVKMLSKDNQFDFKIVDIDWDIHWQTNLYLTVIIRDYLRFFIKNTKAIGNCVIENPSHRYEPTDDDWNKWEKLVNSVADEFDDLLKFYKEVENAKSDDFPDIHNKYDQLLKKAFSDLVFIYDDLWW